MSYIHHILLFEKHSKSNATIRHHFMNLNTLILTLNPSDSDTVLTIAEIGADKKKKK